MSIFNNKKKLDYFYVIFIILFSFSINWKYSRYGVFPIDTFLHYDSAFRILTGEYPFKDYWVVSGVFVDFLQAFFFKIFGVNWYSYIFHASILNVLISILTFYFLIDLNFKKNRAFFYSICFSTLAYPISGTPFVDLHAVFFCIIATYFTFYAIKKPEEYLNWFLVVSFYFFAFFSKIVPTAYFLTLNALVIFFYLIVIKKMKPFIFIFLSSLFYLLIFVLSLKILDIELNDFYIQYIDYPLSIGSDRVNNSSRTVMSFFTFSKFILIPFLFVLFFKIRKILKKKISFSSSEFISFIIFSILFISLILHQSITKNQIFIYFLIPLSFALLEIEIKDSTFKNKNIFIYIILILVTITTVKYHIRYNENRQFHDLKNTDISKHVKSISLDKSLKGIMWISAVYQGSAQSEIEMLKKIKLQLNEKENIMLISNYLFLDSITSINLNSPSRTQTTDGASIPMLNNKYFNYYKNFLYKKIINNKIEEVYFIKSEGLDFKGFTQFFHEDCYQKSEGNIFIFFKLNKICLS